MKVEHRAHIKVAATQLNCMIKAAGHDSIESSLLPDSTNIILSAPVGPKASIEQHIYDLVHSPYNLLDTIMELEETQVSLQLSAILSRPSYLAYFWESFRRLV